MKKRFIFIPVICILLTLSVPFVSFADTASLTFIPDDSLRFWRYFDDTTPDIEDTTTPFSAAYQTTTSTTVIEWPGDWNQGADVGSLLYFEDSSFNAYQFEPDFTYRITFSFTIKTNSRTGASVGIPLKFHSFGLYPNLGNFAGAYAYDNRYVLSEEVNNLRSTFTVDSTDTSSSTANIARATYNITGSALFHLPADYDGSFTLFGWLIKLDRHCYSYDPEVVSGNQAVVLTPYTASASCIYDPGDTIIPDHGEDILNGISDLDNSIQSGFAGLESVINGDGSYGSPESQYADDFDGYESAESEYLDQLGIDSYLNDDYVDDMFVDLGWDQIDVPDRTSAGIFHTTVNPLFQYFPVFIVFPCFLGLIATILGRRKT